jgi:hypothetical protein
MQASFVAAYDVCGAFDILQAKANATATSEGRKAPA